MREQQLEPGRKSLVDQLYREYGESAYGSCKLRAFQVGLKRFNWILVVNGAKGLKRTMDIVVSSIALLVLSPLFLVVAIIIRVQDGGRILFWKTRVGLW